ncbi:MAG: DUF2336 domain-containing protein [Alphaproteobacteria bacterium]|nr:DUF2336 domain-containing protein [Alphaproteobacteria bacterium]
MLGFFKKIFADEPVSYEAQKRMLDSGEPQQLLDLARNEKTLPEILYLLASNQSDAVRTAVAANKSTPVHAAGIIAKDKNADVRLLLASRVAQLLPSLNGPEQAQLYAFAVQALGTLVQDEVTQVRKALSDALRDYAKAPPEIVARLARDVEREVAEPILRFCVALADEDLLDILSNHPASWVVNTIAERQYINEQLANAIIDTNDISAINTLLKNPVAVIEAEKLFEIVERAREYPEWHRPIALRRELSAQLAHRLSGFVDKAVLEVLEKRSDFDPETRQAVADIVKRRIAFVNESPTEEAAARVERYAREKRLTPESIQDAMMWHDAEFATLAIAYLSAIHPQVLRRMIETRKPKPVVAFCRKANLPVRMAVDVQRYLAKVPVREIMYAKQGTDYPLNDDEVKWQLEFFGVPASLP